MSHDVLMSAITVLTSWVAAYTCYRYGKSTAHYRWLKVGSEILDEMGDGKKFDALQILTRMRTEALRKK